MGKKYIGGKVIASGGFGCVFNPALKCVGSKKRERNKVSKLMKTKYAIEEYTEITAIKKKLDKIPNYTNYFIINNLTLCKPSKLTTTDLNSFSEKCSALPKNDITQQNINDKLQNLMILNIPHGGIPVDDYVYTNMNNIFNMGKLCYKLKDMLKKGIIPMNEQNVYHCDIKDSNVLVQQNNDVFMTRLIDWGMATSYIPFVTETFPKSWTNRPLQYNVPFSVIIFSDTFAEKYTTYIQNNNYTDVDNLYNFVVSYIHLWNKERGTGHFTLISNILSMLFKEDYAYDKKEQTIKHVADYIVTILHNFTKINDEFVGLRKYLDEVFIKIIDVYGFICIYYPLLELLYENYNNLSPIQLQLFEITKYIFIKYLYTPRIQPYHLTELFNDLDRLHHFVKGTNPYNTSSVNSNSNKTSSKLYNSIKTSNPLKLSSKRTTSKYMTASKFDYNTKNKTRRIKKKYS